MTLKSAGSSQVGHSGVQLKMYVGRQEEMQIIVDHDHQETPRLEGNHNSTHRTVL